MMSNAQLLDEIRKVKLTVDSVHLNRYVKNHYPELYQEMKKRTKFLSDYYGEKSVPINAIIYSLEHGMTEMPICAHPNCSNIVGWNKTNFRIYCCREHCVSDPMVKDRIRNTCIERYGCESPLHSKTVREKIRQTFINTYGVDNPAKLQQVQEKMKRTCVERFGVENAFQSEEIKARIRHTNKTRYGKEFPGQVESIKEKKKQTLMEHYGVDVPLKCKELVKKSELTTIKRYGYNRVAKSPLYTSYHRKRIFHDGLYFDSTWEVKVYDYLKENHVSFEYSPSISLPYEYDGSKFTYHPDFLVNGKMYEVKGDHFFRINESGHEVMVNPFRDPEWSDEQYEWECGKYEAKHQCMLKNNVIILRESQIENLDSVFNYGKQKETEQRVKHTCVDA